MQKVGAKVAAADGSGLRFGLCGIVLVIYFASFALLLSSARSAAASVQTVGVTTFSISLIVACMLASVATTAIFVFMRRAK